MEQWQVGGIKVVKVVEDQDVWPGSRLMDEMTPDNVLREAQWLVPTFANERGRVLMSFHALLLESAGMRILVDTCVGNDKPRANPLYDRKHTNFLIDLEAAGYPPESIDRVICTHLHIDHIGWNTVQKDGRWVPTFPRARYLFNREEVEHWTRLGEEGNVPVRTQMEDSVRPVIDAGLVDFVPYGASITPEVSIMGTPGHTPGHMSVRLQSQGRHALISGDLLHHPIQCAHPEWKCRFDTDQDQACATRWSFLRECAESKVLLFGTHFLTPSAGRVERRGEAFRFAI
jgi:glyoxylase-like metal-dependent hydrolase (beta-lactamase superfamily II)